MLNSDKPMLHNVRLPCQAQSFRGKLPNVMSQERSRAAAAMGRARTPAKIAAARENIAKATAARINAQTPAQRRKQAKAAAAARWGKKR